MYNIIRPTIKMFKILQYIAMCLGVIVGISLTVDSCSSSNSAPMTNLIIIIPFIVLLFLTIWGFFRIVQLFLEKHEYKLSYQSILVQLIWIIIITIVSSIIAVFAGAILGIIGVRAFLSGGQSNSYFMVLIDKVHKMMTFSSRN